MSSAATRYQTRSPRYTLRAHDRTLLRYAGMDTRGVSMPAEMQNLSETGIAFTLPVTAEAPQEGDVLKIEFTVPGREQIACFSTVVRVESIAHWEPDFGEKLTLQVGVKFRNLPSLYQKALQQSLNGLTSGDQAIDWNSHRQNHLYVFGALSVCMLVGFYVLSLPPQNWSSFVIETLRSIF